MTTSPDAIPLLPSPNEVHVWQADLDALPPDLAEHLDSGERTRAEQFHRIEDRQRFAACRGLLRTLLGRCLNAGPARLRFVLGPSGKPALPGDVNPPRLRFNVSRSGTVALIALSVRREVGVDVERIRPDFAWEATARRFFRPVEIEDLMRLPLSQRNAAFFHLWTRTEALIKAAGCGWSAPPPDPDADTRWTVRALSMPPDFAAAVASEGNGWGLMHRHWPSGGVV